MSDMIDIRSAWLDEEYALALDDELRALLPEAPIAHANLSVDYVDPSIITMASTGTICGDNSGSSFCETCTTRYSRRPCCY
jgi:hypothetical protein